MQRPRHRYQAKSLRFSQRRYELQNRPCRIRLFSEKQIGPINRWGHGLLHGTNHGVKDSNFESKIPSGFYGSFTKTRSQKYIYSYSCSQRSNFKEAEKAKTFTALLCFWKTFSKSLWPKKLQSLFCFAWGSGSLKRTNIFCGLVDLRKRVWNFHMGLVRESLKESLKHFQWFVRLSASSLTWVKVV